MNRYTKYINQNYHYLIFFLFFLLLILSFDDYGYSWDESLSRLNGIVSFNYILEKLNILENLKYDNVPNLNDYIDNEYGVFFELINILFEKTLSLNDSLDIFYFRHLINCLFFFIASIYFYYTLNLFYPKKISILGFLLFVLHPRIFAQSFYNSKDIIFLVFFCISNFYFIKFFISKRIKFLFLLSLVIGLTIGIRVMGIIIPCLFTLFYILENLEKNKFKKIYLIIPFLISTILFTIIFWPYLWENPSNLISSFKSMSDYEWKGLVFFESKYYSAQYLPWYYLPKTILITTPILYILLFIIGSFLIFKFLLSNLINLKDSSKNIWENKEELFCFYSLIIVFFTIVLIIELNSTLYNGWRQVYFIYPSIVFICVYGLNQLLCIKNIRKFVLTIFGILLIYILNWNYQNHPYQYVYYNEFINNKTIKNYELDYWGVSNLKILKKILEISKDKKIKIYKYSNSPYEYSLNMIEKDQRNRLIFTNTIDNAQYIVTNYMYRSKKPHIKDSNLINDFKLVYEINLDNVSINSIYKKK